MSHTPAATPEQLAEIAERAEKATPGPWRVRKSVWEGTRTVEGPRGFDDRVGDTFNVLIDEPADADFIAHAREDIPRLLSTIRDRDKRIVALETKIGDLGETARELNRSFAARALREESERLEAIPLDELTQTTFAQRVIVRKILAAGPVSKESGECGLESPLGGRCPKPRGHSGNHLGDPL